MSSFTLSQPVAAPPAVVFAVLTDVANLPAAIPGITKAELLTPGPIGVGSRVAETRTMFGRPATETFEVVAFDPPTRFTMTAVSCGVEYRCEHTITPDGAGSRLELAMAMTPRTTFAKLMSPLAKLMGGTMKKMIAKDLASLAAAAEKRAGGS